MTLAPLTSMLRRAIPAAGLVLVLFHGWIFAEQLQDGRLADAARLAQWAIAGGLTWALVALRRRGLSIFRSRQGVAIWLLAALLHAPAVADRMGAGFTPIVPEAVATLAGLSLGAAAGGGLFLLLSGGRARRLADPLVRLAAVPAPARPGAPDPRAWIRFAPRPPPVA